MAETLNKRIMPALAREARENTRRYWEAKQKELARLRDGATSRPLAEPNAVPGIDQ